jgi:hypothetical protein
MPLTLATLRHLAELRSGDVDSQREASLLAQSILRDELAAWLEMWVGNPAGPHHLVELFYGEDGVASGNVKACRRFLRELERRRGSRIGRSVIEGGEISQVAEIVGNSVTGWRYPATGATMPMVYKKMPPFFDRADAEGYPPITVQEVQRYHRTDSALWRLWRSFKLLEVLSDGLSGGDWQILRRTSEFHAIWTQPMH